MLTLIQTNEYDRFNVAFEDSEERLTANESHIEGYVLKINDLWVGFKPDGTKVGEGFANPVKAAALVIDNFEDRAAVRLEAHIKNMTARIEERSSNETEISAITKGLIRMRDGLVAKLAARDFL